MAYTYLSRTTSTAGDGKTFTFSAWVKRSLVGSGDPPLFCCGAGNSSQADQFFFGFNDGGASMDKLSLQQYNGTPAIRTNRKFRDTNAWYHIVFAVDTTQATASNRLKIFVNGVQETSFADTNYPTQSYSYALGLGTSKVFVVGGGYFSGYARPYDGLMSHVHYTDGTAYDASYFGSTDSTTGEWQINTSPSVTYGTNGFFILKDTNSGTDQSTNSNNFTVASGSLTKTEDCPSNVFATMNPLDNFYANSSFTYGNTETAMPAANNSFNVSTIGMPSTSGKFYAEVKIITPSQYTEVGISSGGSTLATGGLGRTISSSGNYEWGYTNGNQVVRHNGSAVAGWSGANYSTNDIVAVALDNDNQKIYWSVNGVYQNSGVPTSGATGTGALSTSTIPSFYLFAAGDNHSGGDPSNTILQWNFGNGYFGATAVSSAGTNASGNGIFEYDVPTGYTALSTKGLNL